MKDLQKVYEMASGFLCGDTTMTSHKIIENACGVLSNYPKLKHLYNKCVNYLNQQNNVDESDMIVEEISGFVGEYLAE